MKNKKAILASALIVAAGISTAGLAVPSSPFNIASIVQADDAVYEGLYYTVKDGEATITGLEKEMKDVVIPDAVKDGDNEYPVTAIGANAFNLHSQKRDEVFTS